MRRRLLLALLSLWPLSLAAQVGAGGPVAASDAWAPPSLAGARNGAAYVTLVNHGGAAERLVGASTPVAAKAELHRDEMEGGVMRMRPAGPLALAPGERLTLAPGGLHLMLIGLKQPLKPGDRFPVTLSFEHQPPLTIEATVHPGKPGGHMH